MKKIRNIIFILVVFLFTTTLVNAANVGFVNSNIWLSKEKPIAGDSIKIYSVIVNDTDKKIQGRVVFYDNEESISDPILFTLEKDGESKVINMNWTAIEGEHTFKAQIFNAVSIDENNVMEQIDGSTMSQATNMIIIDVDSDEDGLPDNEEEELGTDPNNPDSDNDGDLDGEDPDPINSQIFNGEDSDGDNVSDKVDTDIDNDGLYNWDEEEIGTDMYKYDTDGDGFGDNIDAFPTNPNKWEQEEVSPTEAAVDNIQKSEKISVEKVEDVKEDVTLDSDKEVLGVKVENSSKLHSFITSKYLLSILFILLVSLVAFLILTKETKEE